MHSGGTGAAGRYHALVLCAWHKHVRLSNTKPAGPLGACHTARSDHLLDCHLLRRYAVWFGGSLLGCSAGFNDIGALPFELCCCLAQLGCFSDSELHSCTAWLCVRLLPCCAPVFSAISWPAAVLLPNFIRAVVTREQYQESGPGIVRGNCVYREW